MCGPQPKENHTSMDLRGDKYGIKVSTSRSTMIEKSQ